MSDEQINIAIAEACGWKRELIGPVPGNRHYTIIPNYLNDLNAMHEAEKILNSEQLQEYYESLGGTNCWKYASSTAHQRAEAFLEVLGKWEDWK